MGGGIGKCTLKSKGEMLKGVLFIGNIVVKWWVGLKGSDNRMYGL